MLVFLSTLLAFGILGVNAEFSTTAVVCKENANEKSCNLVNPSSQSWTAKATHDLPSYNTSGWAQMHVETSQDEQNDLLAAYAAGMIVIT